MRRLDTRDEHAKVMWSDLAIILQNVDAHAVAITQFELQMAQLSTITINANLALFLEEP